MTSWSVIVLSGTANPSRGRFGSPPLISATLTYIHNYIMIRCVCVCVCVIDDYVCKWSDDTQWTHWLRGVALYMICCKQQRLKALFDVAAQTPRCFNALPASNHLHFLHPTPSNHLRVFHLLPSNHVRYFFFFFPSHTFNTKNKLRADSGDDLWPLTSVSHLTLLLHTCCNAERSPTSPTRSNW